MNANVTHQPLFVGNYWRHATVLDAVLSRTSEGGQIHLNPAASD